MCNYVAYNLFYKLHFYINNRLPEPPTGEGAQEGERSPVVVKSPI